MRAELPTGTFSAPVEFTITRLEPAALPPEGGAVRGGETVVVDPVSAYQFDFGVPTLNQDATLTFDIQVDGLDPATRTAFLAALDAGNATLAARGIRRAGPTRRSLPARALRLPSPTAVCRSTGWTRTGSP